MTLTASAPAKVNLTLRVLGRRPDGYHELESCMHALALADTLRLTLLPEPGPVEVALGATLAHGHAVPAGDDNLVAQAAARFRSATDEQRGMRFTLDKRIPAGGGLGGGSSDAAAALVLLDRALGAPLPAAELRAVAAGLGADVPFFLRGGTQLARGIGDRLEPVAAPPHYEFLLLLPPFGTSTAAVYRGLGGAMEAVGGTAPDDLAARFRSAHAGPVLPQGPDGFFNDLESAAFALSPELAALHRQVVDAGFSQARMSGSGSTLFLAFERASAAEAARQALGFLEGAGVTLVRTQSARAGG